MNFSRIGMIVLTLLIVSATTLAQAPRRDWFPESIEALGQNATSRTEFTLDHSMLLVASKLDQDNDELRHIIAGVNGLSVHSFRFPQPGMYDPGTLSVVRDEYRAAGWKHMLGTHSKNDSPGATDLWISFDHNVISNVAILLARQNQLNFIAVSGSISPIELFHLGGHFGIPRMESGDVVPAPATVP